jgi:hypothetical protein
MASQSKTAEQILVRFKGLRNQLQTGEEPLFTIPAIWDGGQAQRSTACDVIVTNQRIMGFFFVSFPRERLFLDAFALPAIQAVSLRHKAFEPLFRELLLSDGKRKVYIRAPRQKAESLYAALRSAIEQHAPATTTAFSHEEGEHGTQVAPIYGRQEILTPFERSSLAITVLFIGGLLLEIGAALLWAATHSSQVGLPLFVAGLVAVVTAILIRRQRG